MKNLKVPYLLDFYGNLFNDKQKEILEMYFQEDMSLSEIASYVDMSRQGVYDNIKRCEKEILSLEGKLNLMDRFFEISKFLDEVDACIDKGKLMSDADIIKIKNSLSKIRTLI